jgi:hypothetical protein
MVPLDHSVFQRLRITHDNWPWTSTRWCRHLPEIGCQSMTVLRHSLCFLVQVLRRCAGHACLAPYSALPPERRRPESRIGLVGEVHLAQGGTAVEARLVARIRNEQRAVSELARSMQDSVLLRESSTKRYFPWGSPQKNWKPVPSAFARRWAESARTSTAARRKCTAIWPM